MAPGRTQYAESKMAGCTRPGLQIGAGLFIGYSAIQFKTAIRPPGKIPHLERGPETAKKDTAVISRRVMLHQKKNGELINVEIQMAPFQYKGAKTNIVIATDITERLKYVKAIEQQNEKLLSISWM